MSLRTQRNSIPLLRFEWKQQYTEEGWYQFYRDDFNNDALGSEWKTHGLNVDKTITELAGVVTIAIANNASGVWYCNVANVAPKMYMQIQQKTPCGVVGIAPPFRITTKLLDYEPAPADTQAGIFIGTDPEGLGDVNSHLAFLFGRWRSNGGNCCVKVDRNCGAYDTMGGVPCLPKWLMIDIDASEDIRFYFGDDGLIWTQYKHLGAPFVLSGEYADPIQVGLFVKNGITDPVAGGTTNISAQFEFFLIEALGERLIDDCVAPIDVRTPNSFYDGRIKSMSSLKRSIDDRTGLFQITDLNVTLKNPDKKYSKMLATHQMKNREAILYHAWTEEDEASKSHMITLIVDDYELRGPEFHVKLKDITQKYFSKKIPENICTEIDFPNIHPDHIGRYMPEILGNASLSPAYAHPGAVEAVYVDRNEGIAPFRCLASAGEITIPANEVWIGDVNKTDGSTPPDPVQYSVEYSGGRTYIHFVAGQDPGDETITFNAHGYSVSDWDSGNGYIQNLAYIILYFLQYTMGVPTSLLNTASFDTLAAYYVALGVGEQCYLIIQDEEDSMEILRELLFTGGAKGFLAKDGRFKVERKDVGNWQISSSDYHIFDQIELFSSSKRQWNLVNAINTVKVEFGYIPWQNMFTGIREDYEENFYDGRQEDHIRRERKRRTRR